MLNKLIAICLSCMILIVSVCGCASASVRRTANSTVQGASSAERRETSSASMSAAESSPSVSAPQASSGSTISIGKKNALASAQQYLNVMAFSYSGLIEQLKYEGYSDSEAKYAADHCGADWKEQAVKAAKQYLDIMSFSRQSLIEQLEFEGYTYDQASYAATQNGY